MVIATMVMMMTRMVIDDDGNCNNAEKKTCFDFRKLSTPHIINLC